jgi:hypothetical protein
MKLGVGPGVEDEDVDGDFLPGCDWVLRCYLTAIPCPCHGVVRCQSLSTRANSGCDRFVSALVSRRTAQSQGSGPQRGEPEVGVTPASRVVGQRQWEGRAPELAPSMR